MCGIAGVAGVADRSAVAAAMAGTLVHRGPDSDGLADVDDVGLALAFRRLAIIDLAPTGAQPMTSASGRWTIVFNGEIYDHRALRRVLEDRGHRFRGTSDTETLVEAVDVWGVEATLSKVTGMFAIAAYDARERRLWLARDRFGEKPLYWTLQGSTFAFASELKALRVVPELRFTIDLRAAASVLRWSFVPHPHTIFEEVRQLPPGALLEVDLAGERPVAHERTWWSLGEAIDRAVAQRRRDVTLDEAADELDELLGRVIGSRLESDVPLGAFLSGGIDSSLIAVYAQRATSGSLRTFTVRMPDAGMDESAHAAVVARHLGTDHEVVDLAVSDALALVPRLSTIWDEPFGDPSMLPTALLCAAARQHLTVCLGGDGGDELFAGYNRHASGAALWRAAGRLPKLLRRAAGGAALAIPRGAADGAGRLLARVGGRRRAIPNVGDKLQKAGLLLRGDDDAWASLAGVWPHEALLVEPYAPSVPHADAELDPIEAMMLVDTAAVLPDQMMVKVDRASMAASLEVRAPLLDPALLDWSWRQPMSVKAAGGTGKLVLRHLARRHLPTEVVERPKMGFDPPLARWLRGELRSMAEQAAAASADVPAAVLDASAARRAWDEHLAGDRNWDARTWALLTLSEWSSSV